MILQLALLNKLHQCILKEKDQMETIKFHLIIILLRQVVPLLTINIYRD